MDANLDLIQNAISSFGVLNLQYKSGIGVISEREIEPLALFFEQNEWNLITFCRLRGEKRQFLLSRVHSLDTVKKSFAANQFSLEGYFREK